MINDMNCLFHFELRCLWRFHPLTFRTTGSTTSPLFRKPPIKSASGINFAFRIMPMHPFTSALTIFPVDDLNKPLCTLLPKYFS